MESLNLAVFGVFLALPFPMALVMTARTWMRRCTWTRTEGTVTSVKTKRHSNGETQTTVRYQYVDSSGQQRSGTDTPWFREPKRKSRLAVMYDPDRPEMSESSSMTWLYLLLMSTLILLVVGVGLVVSGLGGETL